MPNELDPEVALVRKLARYALMAVLSIAIPASWYAVMRLWFESGKGFLYSIFFPHSELVFVWPMLGIVIAWWVVMPKPRASIPNLLLLPVATVGGLVGGVLLGFVLMCSFSDKCL